jgi:hypothetical protein
MYPQNGGAEVPDHALDAVLEIFAWVGFGVGGALLVIALIAFLADGTWLPVRVLIEDTADGRVARWFTAEGGVGQARLTHEQSTALVGKDATDAFYRRGVPGRMRLTQGSPAVRAILLFSFGLIGVGVVSVISSWIAIFARG